MYICKSLRWKDADELSGFIASLGVDGRGGNPMRAYLMSARSNGCNKSISRVCAAANLDWKRGES